jgi:hypothetical protein
VTATGGGADSKKRRNVREKWISYMKKTDFMHSINFKLSTRIKERPLHYRHFLKVQTFPSVAGIGTTRPGRQKPELRHWPYVQELAYFVKVKLSHYRPEQVLGAPGEWGSQISRQLAHEGGKVASPRHRPSLPQELFLLHISVSGWVDPRVIGNRTHDQPAWSAVPRRTAPPRAPCSIWYASIGKEWRELK